MKNTNHSASDAPYSGEEFKYPICPINLYFEGDEDKCDPSKCDFDEFRSCSEACKKDSSRQSEKQHLSTIIEDLKTNLDIYRQDAIRNFQDDTISCALNNGYNEWLLQIADIYQAAYGEELNLDNIIID